VGLPFDTTVLDLGPYAQLFLYSDGVFEIEKPDGVMWTFDEFVPYVASLPEEAPMDRLLAHVRELRGMETLADDFSLVQVAFG
jgi:sigma-B regulation protein RsbU (phosphoserine phosphatase)